MVKIIAFNGAPSSGKDTACKYISEKYKIPVFEFKHKLFKFASEMYGESQTLLRQKYHTDKESKRPEYNNQSLREVFINIAHNIIKPKFGEAYFANQVIEEITKHIDNQKIFAVSDLGFDIELKTLVEKFKPNNVIVIQVFRDGCTFKHDSRKLLQPQDYPGVNFLKVFNNSDLSNLYHQLDKIMENV